MTLSEHIGSLAYLTHCILDYNQKLNNENHLIISTRLSAKKSSKNVYQNDPAIKKKKRKDIFF